MTGQTASPAPLTWQRQAPGVYQAREASYQVLRVEYADGPWWVIVYADGQAGDTFCTKREAVAAVELDRQDAGCSAPQHRTAANRKEAAS